MSVWVMVGRLLGAMWVVCIGVLGWSAAVDLEAGERVSPWTSPVIGFLLVAAGACYSGEELWRALHPPMRFDPATLPQPFDWWEVERRMAAYRDAEGDDDSPEESDSVYLMIQDTVTLEYVDVVRNILSEYDGSVRRLPIEREVGADRSGRPYFVRPVGRVAPPDVD